MTEANLTFDLTLSDIEEFMHDAKKDIENNMRKESPLNIQKQYERLMSEFQSVAAKVMLEYRAGKKLAFMLGN